MTWALCLNCGATKFGAICPCGECQRASTGNMDLDITFSDHRMSEATLKGFGDVVKAIRKVCDDDQLRFWTFIHYVATKHPNVLGVKLPANEAENYEQLIQRAQPPPVIFEESPRKSTSGDEDASAGVATD